MTDCLVIYERGPLPGALMCRTCAAASLPPARADVQKLIREAIEGHIEVMREYGEPIPIAASEAERIPVEA